MRRIQHVVASKSYMLFFLYCLNFSFYISFNKAEGSICFTCNFIDMMMIMPYLIDLSKPRYSKIIWRCITDHSMQQRLSMRP